MKSLSNFGSEIGSSTHKIQKKLFSNNCDQPYRQDSDSKGSSLQTRFQKSHITPQEIDKIRRFSNEFVNCIEREIKRTIQSDLKLVEQLRQKKIEKIKLDLTEIHRLTDEMLENYMDFELLETTLQKVYQLVW